MVRSLGFCDEDFILHIEVLDFNKIILSMYNPNHDCYYHIYVFHYFSKLEIIPAYVINNTILINTAIENNKLKYVFSCILNLDLIIFFQIIPHALEIPVK